MHAQVTGVIAMHAVMSFASYGMAVAATAVFWAGVSEETFLLRVFGAVIATIGIWIAESTERRTRSGMASQAATVNGLLLFVMAVISFYMHFAD